MHLKDADVASSNQLNFSGMAMLQQRSAGRPFKMKIGYCIILVATLASTSAIAADPDHGETLVKRWCVACHLVAADQKAATTDAPPFASVAKRPDFNAAKIASFLLDPHPKMPNMELSRDETADIAAYIATLR